MRETQIHRKRAIKRDRQNKGDIYNETERERKRERDSERKGERESER